MKRIYFERNEAENLLALTAEGAAALVGDKGDEYQCFYSNAY
ncbi:hypothetical protein [Nitrosomonas sp. Nm34]|nr:hypothetical protein [Nitrosomonas sp. Nm34]